MNYFDWIKLYQKKDLEFKSYIKKSDRYLIPENSRIRYFLHDDSQDSQKNRNFVKEASMFFYHKMMEDSEYIDEKYIDETTLEEDELKWVNSKKQVYQPLEIEDVPGQTPLIQACNLLQALLEKQAQQGDTSGVIKDPTSQEVMKAVELINSVKDKIDDDEIKELLEQRVRKSYIPKKMKFNLLNSLSLLEKLGAEFKVEKNIEEEEVVGGTIHNTVIMKRYEQISQIPVIQYLYPAFKVNFANKNLLVDIYTEKTEHIQKIIVLIDCSGSMNDNNKQELVASILLDRLSHVIKGNCELFIGKFERDVYEMTHVYNRETAFNFWSKYDYQADMGGTDMGKVISIVKNQIESKNFFGLNVDLSEERTEVLLINDGQLA